MITRDLAARLALKRSGGVGAAPVPRAAPLAPSLCRWVATANRLAWCASCQDEDVPLFATRRPRCRTVKHSYFLPEHLFSDLGTTP